MNIDFRRSGAGLFASESLSGHLVRGAVAAELMTAAIAGEASHPLAALTAGAVALFALRGCPVCWTIGLFETLMAKAGAHEPVAVEGGAQLPKARAPASLLPTRPSKT